MGKPRQLLTTVERLLHLKKRADRVYPQYYVTGRCPKGMPLAEWRSVGTRWLVLPLLIGSWFVVLLLLCLPIANWLESGSVYPLPPPEIMLQVVLVVGACSTFMHIVLAVRRRRFRRAVRDRRYEVCLDCGYTLRGLPEAYRCPECGCTYNIEEVCKVWEDWIEMRRPAPRR